MGRSVLKLIFTVSEPLPDSLWSSLQQQRLRMHAVQTDGTAPVRPPPSILSSDMLEMIERPYSPSQVLLKTFQETFQVPSSFPSR